MNINEDSVPVYITAIVAAFILLFAVNVRGCIIDSNAARVQVVKAAVTAGEDPVRAMCAWESNDNSSPTCTIVASK